MIPAAICTLALLDTTLTVDDGGFLERTDLTVEAPCAFLTIDLPATATLVEAHGKGKLSDDTRRKLDDVRWRASEPSANGRRSVTVFLGDLLPGDRAELSITRRWATDRFVFDPAGAERVRLRVPAGVQTSVPVERGLVEGGADLGVVEVLRPQAPSRGFAVPYPSGPPAGDVTHGQRLTLIVPEGDPQRLLYPGAGSSVKIEDFYTFPPSSLPRSLAVPVPSDADVTFAVEPEQAAEMLRGPDVALIRVQAWEGPVRVGLVHTEPDAPTFGERPADVDEYKVAVPGGEIAWQGDAWHLVRVGKRPIVPNAKSLLDGLDHRFRQVALPEPGLPQDLRGRARTWDLAADLRPSLFERALPGLPADSLWPRKLIKARKSGLMSDTEAMLTIWLYGQQAGLRTDWALVRPAHLGDIDLAVPSGFTGALVRVDGGDTFRFIDAGCQVCAPFEVRPWLEGGTVLSPAGLQGPEPTRGLSDVQLDEDRMVWTLEGPAALLLRLWLEPIPAAARGRALAERLAGPDARLIATEGIGDAGAPVRVEVAPGRGVRLDPLSLPPAGADGTWVDWIGTRSRSFPASGDVHDAAWSSGPIRYTRRTAEGRVTESLTVEERQLPASVARTLDALRHGIDPRVARPAHGGPSLPEAPEPPEEALMPPEAP